MLCGLKTLVKSDSDHYNARLYWFCLVFWTLFLSLSLALSLSLSFSLLHTHTHTHIHRVWGHRWHGGVRVREVCSDQRAPVWPLQPSLAFFFSFCLSFYSSPSSSFGLTSSPSPLSLHLSSFFPLICSSEVLINYLCLCLSPKPRHLSSATPSLLSLSSRLPSLSSSSQLLSPPLPPTLQPPLFSFGDVNSKHTFNKIRYIDSWVCPLMLAMFFIKVRKKLNIFIFPASKSP